MNQTFDPSAAEIVDEDPDTESARLDRAADAILLEDEGRAFAHRPLRRAVLEDAALARQWGQARAVRMREAVEAEPIKATLYALGLGVVVGLLISR
ncbi:hypothetical protein [Brevundimonas sp.]|uniref:hypothetical protein n=1 Tax=Brevundimonas sp. TaxID=1871086 RepID=UPI0012004A55|nr:hypothetical protein [Brevundimonas sp.]TAJ67431.1 MAG: hypothetical protein EPO49_00770 [Brevundimonas sp.]